MSAPRHVFLVDGSGFIFRAYHALPPLTRPDGTPVGAVLGFSNMLLKLLQGTDADHIAVVFDTARVTFRSRIYPEYKAQRPPPPDDLIPQFKLVREATDAFNVCRVERDDYEADDLMAAYAARAVEAGAEVTIVSSDKDMMQLVSDHVRMLDPIKDRPIGAAEVQEKFGVGPDKVIDVQALCGDSVDNVPGVKGISEETAGKLIDQYGRLEPLLELAKSGELKTSALRDAKDLETRIWSIAGQEFNPNSPKQLGEVLFGEKGLRLPGGKKGKTGVYAVNVEVLDELAGNGVEIASLILRWRFFNRVVTTLADVLVDPEQVKAARLSRELVTLDKNAPLPLPLEALAVKPLDREKLQRFLTENNFRTLLARVARLGQEPARPTGLAPAAAAAISPSPMPEPDTSAVVQRYELIQDMAALDRWIAAATVQGMVAMDTETTSVNSSVAELVGVSLALAPGHACYIPLAHRAPEGELHPAPPQLKREEAVARLKPLLEDESVLKIGQNIKYDIAVLAGLGVHVAPTDCTMLMSFVLDGAQHGHGLDELAKIHFGHDTIKYKDVAGSGKDHVGFAAVPLERARDYAAEDADFTWRLHRRLKPRLIEQHMLAFYETVERPLAAVVAEMERAGIAVDKAELKRLSEDFGRRLASLETEIHKLAGHPFNVGSPKQLGEVLFDELGLAGGKKGKTGAYGTDAGVLEQLALTHDLPARVLDWRQLAKLKSTYADALVEQVNPATGRVHTSYALAATSTGRIASTDPNLQNIPIRTEEGRKIRHAFIAAPGHVLISADYSQIEMRLAAHVADVGALKEAFRAGDDIHARTASEVFGVPLKGIDPNLRRRAKAINFGIIYGISAFGLASQLGIAQSEASDYIKAYFQRFPGIRDYMERAKAEAREKGYVETLFGRRCYIPGIKDANPARRAGAERQAINAPLQGAAADIIKRAMRRVPGALAASGLNARMLLQVHDELVFEAPDGEAKSTAALVAQVMEGAPLPARELSVPLVVETGMARNWDEAH